MSQYYKKYMKKRDEDKPSPMKLFIGVFLLMVMFCIIVATHAMISVDTTIGENDEGDIKESGLGVKHLIDSRLKFIQMEDRGSISGSDDKLNNTINVYERTSDDNQQPAYQGQYQDSYGNNQTQPTKPLSQSYNNSQPSSQTTTSTQTGAYQTQRPASNTLKPAPVPTSKPASSYVPSYQVKKDLAPTGMN